MNKKKEDIEGVILILTCHKHLNTRLKEFSLPNDSYENWKVVYVIGDLRMDNNFELRGNMLHIKCEDSYIHLLKKLTLAIKYVNELFTIKQGILRCGDDLVFNTDNLNKFLNGNKYDFFGQSYYYRDYHCSNINELKKLRVDTSMYNYYKGHPEDFSNPLHNLGHMSLEKIKRISHRPDVWGPAGIIYYISNKTCDILLDHMERIQYNIFHFDHFTNSYPYTIEDTAVTYIMYLNQITFKDSQNFFDTPNAIVKHTNKYKDNETIQTTSQSTISTYNKMRFKMFKL